MKKVFLILILLSLPLVLAEIEIVGPGAENNVINLNPAEKLLYSNSTFNQTLADLLYVKKAGDTMTGNLIAPYLLGLYNWTVGDDWATFTGATWTFNESKLSTIYYSATQSHPVAGSVAGDISYTQHPNGAYDDVTINITEGVGSPGLDLRVNFTSVEDFNGGIIRYYTGAIAGDYPIIQLWDYDEADWEDYPYLAETGGAWATVTQPVYDSGEHLQGGVVQMRLYKASPGNTNNKYYVDWLAVTKGYGTPSGEETDPLALHRDGSVQPTGSFNFARKNITNVSIMEVNGLTVTNKDGNNTYTSQDTYFKFGDGGVNDYLFLSSNSTSGVLYLANQTVNFMSWGWGSVSTTTQTNNINDFRFNQNFAGDILFSNQKQGEVSFATKTPGNISFWELIAAPGGQSRIPDYVNIPSELMFWEIGTLPYPPFYSQNKKWILDANQDNFLLINKTLDSTVIINQNGTIFAQDFATMSLSPDVQTTDYLIKFDNIDDWVINGKTNHEARADVSNNIDLEDKTRPVIVEDCYPELEIDEMGDYYDTGKITCYNITTYPYKISIPTMSIEKRIANLEGAVAQLLDKVEELEARIEVLEGVKV